MLPALSVYYCISFYCFLVISRTLLIAIHFKPCGPPSLLGFMPFGVSISIGCLVLYCWFFVGFVFPCWRFFRFFCYFWFFSLSILPPPSGFFPPSLFVLFYAIYFSNYFVFGVWFLPWPLPKGKAKVLILPR